MIQFASKYRFHKLFILFYNSGYIERQFKETTKIPIFFLMQFKLYKLLFHYYMFVAKVSFFQFIWKEGQNNCFHSLAIDRKVFFFLGVVTIFFINAENLLMFQDIEKPLCYYYLDWFFCYFFSHTIRDAYCHLKEHDVTDGIKEEKYCTCFISWKRWI